jgi:hypothetical protein
MSADDERWLRDRLTAVVDAEQPPADLATRAERTAGRIRRRRFGTAAGVAAVVVAVTMVLGGAGITDRSLPPALPPDPACVASDQALPEQPDAVSAADVTWPYRGDPALLPALERVIAGTLVGRLAGFPEPWETRPLYAQRLAHPAGSAVFVFASEFAGQWIVVARVLPPDASGDLDLALARSPGTDARLPRLAATAQLSLLVAVPVDRGGPVPTTGWDRMGNLLVALAPPGVDEVDYTACYRGRPFTVTGRGDALVREVGPVDAPGQVRMRAGDRVVAAGEVGDPRFGYPAMVLPAVEPVAVPAGMREVQRLRGQGEPQPVPNAVATVPAARLIARCRGPEPLEVAVGDRVLGRVPCDEQVHVVAEGVALEQGRPLAVRGVPGIKGDVAAPVSYDVVVVTAG